MKSFSLHRIVMILINMQMLTFLLLSLENNNRWNMPVIEPLVKGTIDTLMKSGVKAENIVVENVSGSYELPAACSRWVACSLSWIPSGLSSSKLV